MFLNVRKKLATFLYRYLSFLCIFFLNFFSTYGVSGVNHYFIIQNFVSVTPWYEKLWNFMTNSDLIPHTLPPPLIHIHTPSPFPPLHPNCLFYNVFFFVFMVYSSYKHHSFKISHLWHIIIIMVLFYLFIQYYAVLKEISIQ